VTYSRHRLTPEKDEKARPTMGRKHCSRGAIEWGFIAAVAGGGVAALIIIGLGVGLFFTHRDKTVVEPSDAACGCPALLDMINRRDLAKAAIKSIDGLSNVQSGNDARAGKAEMYSDELYVPGKEANQAAIRKANTGAPPGAGETPPYTCSPDVSAGTTECMRASLRAHENVHQQACLANTKRFANYKYAKTMVEFWQEDHDGYQAEVDFLTRNIDKCMHVSNYPGAQSKEEEQQRRAGSKRRVTQYGAGLPA
jgi:hypothetical protein